LPDDEEDQQKAIDALGFMLRAPATAITFVPFVLGAFIWPFITKVSGQMSYQTHPIFKWLQSKTFRLDREKIEEAFLVKIVEPFLNNLKFEGQKSLQETMRRSGVVAKAAVADALEREDERYMKERLEKQSPPPKKYIAAVVAAHANFIAAEAAFQTLRNHLLKFI
jgi:hypothetical protein